MRLFPILSASLIAISLASPLGFSQQEPTVNTTSKSGGGISAQEVGSADLFTGRFSYGVGIDLPPARGGSTPSLGLSYSSAGGNGWCGVGWGLGVGAIEREGDEGVPIAKTASGYLNAYDDAKGFVAGGRLLDLGGNIFRPEIDGGSARYERDIANNRWIVTDISGNRSFYGRIDASQEPDAGQSQDALWRNPKSGWGSGWSGTFRWMLKKTEDANGNRTYFDYQHDGNTPYLSRVRYNGHKLGVDTTHEVEFVLGPRPDVSVSARSGFAARQTKRLQEIVVRVLLPQQSVPSLVRKYVLDYEISSSTGKSRLSRVTQFGKDGVTSLPPVQFTYSELAKSFGPTETLGNLESQVAVDSDPYWNSTSAYGGDTTSNNLDGLTTTDLVDVDRDGWQDRVMPRRPGTGVGPALVVQYRIPGAGFRSGLMQIDGLDAPNSSLAWGSPRFTGASGTAGYTQLFSNFDFDRDGYGDWLCRQSNSVWKVQASRYGMSFTAGSSQTILGFENQGDSGVAWTSPESSGRASGSSVDTAGLSVLADFNGDGRPDRAMRGRNSNEYTLWKVQLNTGSGFEPSRIWPVDSQGDTGPFWNAMSYFVPWIDSLGLGSGHTNVTLLDINGDGLPDRVSRERLPNQWTGPGNNPNRYDAFAVQLNNGAGFEPLEWWPIDTYGQSSEQWGSPVGVEMSPNVGSSSDPAYYEPNTSLLRDINADGLLDIVSRSPNLNGNNTIDHFLVQLNTGAGFAPTQNWSGVAIPGPSDLQTTVPTSGGGSYLTHKAWGAPQASFGFGAKFTFTDLVDLGDGLPVRIMKQPNLTLAQTGNDFRHFLVQRQLGSLPDLLVGVSNSLGGSTQVEYVLSSHWDNREKLGVPDPWSEGVANLLAHHYPTVRKLIVRDGMNNPDTGAPSVYETNYLFQGGFFDGVRRESRGFFRSEQIHPDGTRTVTYFHQGGGPSAIRLPNGMEITPVSLGEFDDTSPNSFAKAGTAFRTELYGNDASNPYPYQISVDKVEAMDLGAGRVFPYTSQTVAIDSEGLGGSGRGVASRPVFERFGVAPHEIVRAKESHSFGEVAAFVPVTHVFSNVSGDETVAETSYTTIPGNPNILDRVSETKLFVGVPVGNTLQKGQLLRHSKSFYYPDGKARETWQAKRIPAGTGDWIKASMRYDIYGNLVGATDAMGIVSSSEYENFYHQYPYRTIADVRGFRYEARMLTDYLSGAVLEATDMNGVKTKTQFDVFFRATQTSIVVDGQETWQTRMEYILGGIGPQGGSRNAVKQWDNHDFAGDPNGRLSISYVDGLGRSVQARAESEDLPNRFRVADTLYDFKGNPNRKTHTYFSQGEAYTLPSSNALITASEYDAVNRVKRIVPPAGESGSPMGPQEVFFHDNGTLWTSVGRDAMGRERKERRDALGRTAEVIDTAGRSSYFTYRLTGEVETLTDPQGNTIRIEYDVLGRRIAMEDPDVGRIEYRNDDLGRVIEQVDAKGNRTQTDFDTMGRVVETRSYRPDGVLENRVQNFYDTPFVPGQTVYRGQLSKVVDSQGEKVMSYDRRGLLQWSRLTLRALPHQPARTFTFSYEYDAVGKPRIVEYPGGLRVEHLYDNTGVLREVRSDNVLGVPMSFYRADGFSGDGSLISMRYGNGVTTSFDYYASSRRLREIRAQGPAGLVQQLGYSYDLVGNVVSVADQKYPSGPASAAIPLASYDNLYRLQNYTRYGPHGLTTRSFTYDAIGNLLTNGDWDGPGAGQTYLYQSPLGQPHAVTRANGKDFEYDRNGNMTKRGDQSMEYNADNRLVRVWRGNQQLAEYGYDGSGTRVWKRAGGKFTLWIAGAYEERDEKKFYHIVAAGRRVCTFEMPDISAGILAPARRAALFQFQHPDALQSASTTTDGNGQITQRMTYLAFGQTNYEDFGNTPAPSHRFTGQILDDETGLYDFVSRFYDPQIGRFTQADTIVPSPGDSQAHNRFSYVLNTPLRFNDPSGHAPQEGSPATYLMVFEPKQDEAAFQARLERNFYSKWRREAGELSEDEVREFRQFLSVMTMGSVDLSEALYNTVHGNPEQTEQAVWTLATAGHGASIGRGIGSSFGSGRGKAYYAENVFQKLKALKYSRVELRDLLEVGAMDLGDRVVIAMRESYRGGGENICPLISLAADKTIRTGSVSTALPLQLERGLTYKETVQLYRAAAEAEGLVLRIHKVDSMADIQRVLKKEGQSGIMLGTAYDFSPAESHAWNVVNTGDSIRSLDFSSVWILDAPNPFASLGVSFSPMERRLLAGESNMRHFISNQRLLTFERQRSWRSSFFSWSPSPN